jgi:hypothetical protein
MSRFYVYFDRIGKDDWVVHEIGKGVRLTKKIHIDGRVQTRIRGRQPRAVLEGVGAIAYSRRRTLITC